LNLSPNREHLAQCEAPETDLTTDEAFVILEPYFLAAQELFLDAGLRKTERTRFYVAPWVHDSPRHFAATRDDGLAVMMAPEAAELPEGTVAAFFAHELGHATDFLYPGEWVLGEDRIAVRRERAEWTDEQWAKWIRSSPRKPGPRGRTS